MTKKTIKRLVPIEVNVVETYPASIRVIKSKVDEFKIAVHKVPSLQKYFSQKSKDSFKKFLKQKK